MRTYKTKEAKKIIDRILSDFDKLKADKYQVLGVFLQGSQNYCLSDEKSDIDTKGIVIPNLKDLVDKKLESKTIILEDNSHIDLKDIRKMMECFLKQNINFLEILFTDFYCVDLKYAELWDEIFYKREEVVFYDKKRGVQAIWGDMNNKYKSMYKLTPHTEYDYIHYGYSLKDFHHLIRLSEFIERYIKQEEKYEEMLIPKDIEYIMQLKRVPKDLDEVKIIVEKTMAQTESKVESFLDKYDKEKNEEIKNFLENLSYRIIKKMIIEEKIYE